jgi:hypothetical protein
MTRRPFLLLALLAALAPAARADLRLLASATSDSYQSLTYGLSAFCQAAGFPFALTEINTRASELLLIPNLAGVDVQQRLWLLWLADEPRADQPASIYSVALLPTSDNGETALQALQKAYPVRTEDEALRLWRYAAAGDAGKAGPVLYVTVRRGTVMASASRAAVAWAASRPLPTPPAGAVATAGQVRFEFQPAALAAMVAEGQDSSEESARVREILHRVLTETRSLALLLEATTEGVTVRLTLAPVPGSALARHLLRVRPPAPPFWRFCPDRATVAAVSGGTSLWRLPDGYETNRTGQARGADAVLGECLTGDSAMYVSRMSATGTLYFAQILGVTDGAAAWARLRKDPLAMLPFETSFRFATNATRSVCGVPVVDLIRTGLAAAPKGSDRHNPADMAAFMVRDGGLCLAATGNLVVATFGASNAIEQVLQWVAAPPSNNVPLTARCNRLLPDLPAAPSSAVLLQPAGLVREIASSLPGLKPDRVAALPAAGDGIAGATTRAPDGTLHLNLRVTATEVSRFQDAMSKGQAALQELFMQMALQQILQMERRLDDADPRGLK